MIGLVIVLVFIAASGVGLAFFMIKVNREGLSLSGKVSRIEECPQKSLVTLSLPDGHRFRISTTNRKLDGIQVGDEVIVREVKGRAYNIKKTGANMAETGPG